MRGCKIVGCGLLLAVGFVAVAEKPETHVDPIVRRILSEVSKVKAQDPAAVPMAFWDLDGTIICGDSGFGLIESGRVRYRGLIEELILGGMNSIYHGEEGYRRWQRDYQYMTSIGSWLAQSFDAQMYAGIEENKLDDFCREVIQKQCLESWYFSSSIAIWKALADAGIENYIVSANAEALIRNLAPSLGIPRERIRGVRVVSEGGRWTTKLRYPIPNEEGKTEAVRITVQTRPHGVAVAAFGNSYATDGYFLRYVATQPSLPGGAKGTAVMINGGHPQSGFSEHFICVQQQQIVGSCEGCCLDKNSRPRPRLALKERIQNGIEVYGIVHWGLNTFTDREWGYGDEDPQLLNPDAFDANQIVEACRAGGLQGLIIVAKHHDGFCLWPTKTTEHNITKSPFRSGQGNYVKEMELACRKYGLKFGVYISPWDRNNAAYGSEKYVTDVFQMQIRELLSGDYGEIFEMWFDGANGGDGYYGGARERRKIPNDYYRYETETFAMVRKLQPKICIFNEGDGADYRWPGNERGRLSDDSAATIRSYNPKMYHLCSNSGDLKTGTTFHPPECDFPLRKGWFYHEKDTNTVRCGEYLMRRYLNTVGNGGTMNIGIAPDKHGRLASEDVAALKRFGELKKEFFARTGDEQGRCNVIVLSEDVSNGEFVDSWKVTANGKTIASGSALGIKRIRVLPQPIVKTDIKPVEFNLREGGLPDGFAIRQMFYYVEPKTLNRVMNATTTNGETDTAQWMTKSAIK